MPYIGNPIYQSAFVTDQFSGDGTTTAFTMSVSPAGTTNVLVVVSGVVQDPSTYGVTGTTLNFSAAPPSGTGNISCRYLGVPVTGVTTTAYRTVTEFTATASQTTFTPPSYNVGFINVYLNGVLLGSADYTATNGTTVVLATGAAAGNLVTVESFQISSVANAIQNSAGSVSNSNLATGAVTPAKLSTGGPYWDTSGNLGVGTASPGFKLDVYSGASGVVANLDSINAYNAETGLTFSAQRAKISGFLNGSGGTPGSSLVFYTMPDGGSVTERMRIDSSGRVTTPYQPTVEVNRQSNFAVTSNENVGTVVPFVNARLNIGSNYSLSTNRFTAPVTGNYQFHWSYGCNTAVNTTYRTYLWINGVKQNDTQLRNDNNKTGSAYTWGSRTMILGLSASDYVELRASSDTGTDFYADGSLEVNMGISLIS